MAQAVADYQSSRLGAFLESPEVVREYLGTILAGEGPESLIIGMREIVNFCGGPEFFSRKTGLERAIVDEIMLEGKIPSLASVSKMLKALGLRIAFKPNVTILLA